MENVREFKIAADQPKKDIFKQHFPIGEIQPIDLAQIPKVAVDFFESKSGTLINRSDYRPSNFEACFVVDHQEGGKTFLAQQTKTYSTHGATEALTYLVDIDSDGNIAGFGELRLNLSDSRNYFKDKPFVGYTQTERTFQRRGLGTRRLRLMNAISNMLYSLPLHSDTLLGQESRGVWEKLVRAGLARKYKQGKHDRFSFISQ